MTQDEARTFIHLLYRTTDAQRQTIMDLINDEPHILRGSDDAETLENAYLELYFALIVPPIPEEQKTRSEFSFDLE